MRFLGTAGMPRRVFDYQPAYTALNVIATIGAFMVAAGQIPFIMNVWWSRRTGTRVHGDPWNDRPALEWRGFKSLPGGPVMARESQKWGGGKP